MHVHSDLSLEFLGQLVKYRLFIQRHAAVPLIVKPVLDVFFQLMTHLPIRHLHDVYISPTLHVQTKRDFTACCSLIYALGPQSLYAWRNKVCINAT